MFESFPTPSALVAILLVGPNDSRPVPFGPRNKMPRVTFRSIRAVAVLLLCCTAGCEPKGEGTDATSGERVWTSEHFVYSSRASDESVCEGVLGTLEAHFDALHAYLQFPWPEGTRVRYHKFRNRSDLMTHGACSIKNDSCFFRERGVHTHQGFDQHELVHAYLAALGDSHPVLEEGLAEALSCGAEAVLRDPDFDLTTAFSLDHWRGADRTGLDRLYRVSTWFVGDLLTRFGPERFMQLYRALRRDHADSATAASVFSTVMGEPLDEAWRRAMANDDPSSVCVQVWPCAAKPWPEQWQASWFRECAQSDHAYSLDLTAPTWVIQESGEWGFQLGSCDPRRPTPHADFTNRIAGGASEAVFWLALDSGRYHVTRHPRAPASGLTVGPLTEALGSACEEVEPLTAVFEHDLVIALDAAAFQARSPGVVVRWLDHQADAYEYAVECDGVNPQWCWGCDPFACEDACDRNVRARHRRLAGEDVVLRIPGEVTRSGWLRIVRLR